MKIGFIGCGNMGQAILKGMIDKKLVSSKNIFVCDKDKKKISNVTKKYKVKALKTVIDLVEKVQVIIFAIKPQDSELVLSEISPYIDHKKLLISIMAGITTKKIEKHFIKGISVARVMPNMAAFVGQSVSSIAYNNYVSAKHKKIVKKIFSAVGEIYETIEKKKDVITALSGSGPAYFFYMIEAFVDAGIKNGLSRKDALLLIVNTLKGSAEVLKNTDMDPLELRKMVTSKRGTTEAAIDVFNRSDLKKIIIEAVTAAKKRSEEISK
ncbi:MAG: pyrroline-5-carboxylate reductase [Candidatus Omnitrophica bacterium]|nr:pyrroline-5-carboxylate reductase [Candidatus Omnitrophota bacterium]